VFDVLVVHGLNVIAQPLLERKALLADVLAFSPPSVREVGFVEVEGEWLYPQAVALELEGGVGSWLHQHIAPDADARLGQD
jgi:ATP-dependent DNA ligase